MQRQQTKFWPVELFCFFQWVSALYIYVVFFVLFFWQVVKVKAVFIAATMSTRDAYLNIVDVSELIKRLGLSGFFLYISSGGSWRLVAESRATWSPIWSEVIWMIWLIFPDLSLCFFSLLIEAEAAYAHGESCRRTEKRPKGILARSRRPGFAIQANETNKKFQAKKLNSESKAWPRVESNWGIVFSSFYFFLVGLGSTRE